MRSAPALLFAMLRPRLLPLALLGILLAAPGCTLRPTARIWVDGLNQPRGMALDPAGNLYVAETGTRGQGEGATQSTNHSGRVLQIAPTGSVSVVMAGLPYSYLSVNGDVGPADVAVVGHALYVLTGEGDDDNLSRRILQVVPGGRAVRVANLVEFVAATEGRQATKPGRLKANPYALVPAPTGQAFFVSDGASGRVLRVTPDGEMTLFAELPEMPPLAGMAFGPDGRLYLTRFSHWPHAAGSGSIWAADASGTLALVVAGLTMPIDVGFDPAGRLYVLEFSGGGTVDQPYLPRRGRLLRMAQDGTPIVLLDRLNYPTAMIFSPQGDLYLTVGGAFSPAGTGAILHIAATELDP